jgi:putative spermidine/putrescine transport system substrate-binding protein
VTTPSAAGDLLSQFPADVQPLLEGVSDPLLRLLLDIRSEGPQTLLWSDSGGEYHQGQRRAYLEDWEKITGWTVQNVAQSGSTTPPDFEVKTRAGEPEWDVVLLDGVGDAVRFRDLLEPIDLSLFPEANQNFVGGEPIDTAINNLQVATVLAWNTEAFPLSGTHPTKVSDFYDTTNFPGKRCHFSFSDYGLLELMLLADGVPPGQVYPTLATDDGIRRAFSKLASVRADLVFADSGGEQVQFLLDRQCDLGIIWNGRPALRIKDEPDLPLAITRDGSVISTGAIGIPKGATHAKAGLSALAWSVMPKNMCRMADVMGYGVVTDPSCLTEFAREWGPDTSLASLVVDQGFYLERQTELTELWAEFLTGTYP